MRTLAPAATLVGLVLAACVQQSEPDPPVDPGGPVAGDPGSGGYECMQDSDCGAGEVCARTYACLTPDQVRTVHITWTLQGQAASPATCSSSPDLEIDFDFADGGWWGWSPVPCSEGVFTIDKMPIVDDQVAISLANDASGSTQGVIDPTTGAVAIDLPF